jgi:hypothetical protein
MKEVGGFPFPETKEEADAWEPVFYREALHQQIIVVGKTRIEGKWNAYIFPVPGHNHEQEMSLWETEGAKLSEDLARMFFPQFEGVPYAR